MKRIKDRCRTSPRPKVQCPKSIVLLLLVPCVLLVLSACGGKAKAPGGGAPGAFAIPVEMVTAEATVWQTTVKAVGTLAADEEVQVRNAVAGYVARIVAEEGGDVDKDAILVSIDADEYNLRVDQAQALLDEAESNLSRKKVLKDKDLVSESELTTAENAFAAARAEAGLARKKLKDTKVKAPMAGRLGKRYVSVGDYVGVGTPLFDLVKLDRLKVDFSLPQQYLSKVKEGQTVTLTTSAYPDETFEGVVDFIDPVLDAGTRRVKVRAIIDNSDGRLTPELFVNVELELEKIQDAVVIPEEALISGIGGIYVFVAVEGVASRRVITINDRAPGKVWVGSGVAAGEQVVTAGHQKLQEGVPVMTMPGSGE
ncbi:MAG: efflux RND transporter periplasmic adaptor subunit [Verrucomicrobia bacterium]|nr:efflux RND transporter periplasmic adaptor subunit [Verrucomicrobiota bacterium]